MAVTRAFDERHNKPIRHTTQEGEHSNHSNHTCHDEVSRWPGTYLTIEKERERERELEDESYLVSRTR